MKGIGIGESDFRNLRIRDNYFIDKSLFIKDIIDDQSRVALITRPRRFGKTLNMSMLRYYFDCSQSNTKELFNGLKIMEQGEEYTSKQGAYPCIYMTLNAVSGRTYEQMLVFMQTLMMDVYYEHKYLLEDDITEGERAMYNKILAAQATEEDLINSVRQLSKLMYRHSGKFVMLFVDEYDVPIQEAYVEEYYEQAIKFFRSFYKATFKDNPYMEKTVLTGVSRVSKESIFSGANNFDVYTVLDNEFAQDFGITREEMKQIIKDFNIQEDEENLKEWYDGYTIGNYDGIYNPWSILNFLKKQELMPYWVNTSSNDLIKLVLKKSLTVKEKMEQLLNDEAIEVMVNQETVIVGIEDNEDNIWGLLVGTGYLKVVETVDIAKSIYKVKIPNREIAELFGEIIRRWFSDKVVYNNLNTILKDLTTLKLSEFEKKFRILVAEMFSFWDVGSNNSENFYHAFVLGMLVDLKDTYYINSNRESGFGRYDIMLEPKDKNGNAFIMEFKVLEDMEEKTIDETIQNAKNQIEEKKYEDNLRERGINNITKMVFAFKGKEVKMEAY